MAITTATQAAQIVNQSMKALGYEYQIDTTSGETIEEGFKSIGVFSPSALRQILDQAVTILIHRNYGIMFDESDNPTRVFWRDFINYGGGEEDIFHHVIEAENGFWADDFGDIAESDEAYRQLTSNIANDLVSFKKPELSKKIHTDFVNFRIKLSRSDLLISEIFTPTGFARFVDTQMANIQWSAEYKLMNIVIDNVKAMVANQAVVFYENNNLNSSNGVTSMVESIRNVSDGMQKPVGAFNKDGVINKSSFDDLYLVTTPEFINRISVRGYANAYNLKEYRDNNKVIELPAGTNIGVDTQGKPVYAVLVDRRAVMVALRYWSMMPFNVSNTDYINFFLKVRAIKGYNEFFNAVAFSGDEIENFTDGDLIPLIFLDSAGVGIVDATFINGVKLSDYPKSANIDADMWYLTVPKGSVVELTTTFNGYWQMIPEGFGRGSMRFSSDDTFAIYTPTYFEA